MKKLTVLLLAGLLLTGCMQNDINTQDTKQPVEQADNQSSDPDQTQEQGSDDKDVNEDQSNEGQVKEENQVNEEDQADENQTTEDQVDEPVDLTASYQDHQVNETGKMIVIMYHNLADKPGTYATTPDLFRSDLERLYREGYRTVSMSDLVDNTISIPLGTTPVVLTFDDGHKSNFYYDDQGQIAKDSVVGILEDFYKDHPDFGRNAIFYLNGGIPFGQTDSYEKKLRYLIDNGYEIGNHSLSHANLSKIHADAIQKQLGKNKNDYEDLLAYTMRHLSIPFGERPKSLEDYLWSGSYDDRPYKIDSAVNVGWNPINSPAHHKFNARSINRITCGDDHMELNWWLDDLKNKPSKRYYSDGDPNTVVVSEDRLDTVNDIYKDKVITYKTKEEE